MNRKMVRLDVVTLVIALAVSSGCIPASDDGTTEEQGASGFIRPVRIALFFDKSRSMITNGVEQPTVDSVIPLIDLLGEAGGEIAVGRIADRSNVPLVRLRIEAPPLAPERPSEDANPFELADRMVEFQREARNYQARLEEWADRSVAAAEAFLETVRNILEAPPNKGQTDVWSAVGRGSRFLAEPSGGTVEPERFLILVTDGEDNVRAAQERPPATTFVAVVHGAGQAGVLESLTNARFESFDAAALWVLSTAQGGGRGNSAWPTR